MQSWFSSKYIHTPAQTYMINIIRLKEKRCVIIFRDIKNAFNLMYFPDYLRIGKIGGKFKLLNL